MRGKFTVSEMILISLIAAISIVTKPYLKALAAPLPIAGVVMGAIYMMWVVFIALLINKKYSATLFSLLQAILALALGVAGKWGLWVFIGYTLPGLVVDFIFMSKTSKLIKAISSGAAANFIGSFIAMLLFTPNINNKLVLLAPSLFSGAIGGFLALSLYKFMTKIGYYKSNEYGE